MNLTDNLTQVIMQNLTQLNASAVPEMPAPPITLPPQATTILGKIGEFCSHTFIWAKAWFVRTVPMDFIVIAAMALFCIIAIWLVRKLMTGRR
jgi:hypothetical protein